MEKITRRLFMRKSAALPIGLAAIPITAPAKDEALAKRLEPVEFAADRVSMWEQSYTPPTPQERLDKAILEMKLAVKAIDPSISDWSIIFAADEDLKFRFMALASREPIGR